MKEYVLIHPKPLKELIPSAPNLAFRCRTNIPVLFILKKRPAWQKGRLNLVGGKIEDGETPDEAARRELKEEAGWSASDMRKMGEIIGLDSLVHCFVADIERLHIPLPRDEETEEVEWRIWNDVKNDYRLMPNLRIIIPLLHTETKGWRIVDQESSVGVDSHKVSVELPIDVPFING
jgi:8-oxo-dGTP pyrophosphatase MutT (NUDIX family)